MKRVILTLILFAALAAATAPAEAMAPTCGGSATADVITHTGPPTHWIVYWSQNCGEGKTVEWLIQESPDANGPWTTDTDRYHITTADEANHWVYDLQGNDYSFTCSNSKTYRLRVKWDGGSDDTFFVSNC